MNSTQNHSARLAYSNRYAGGDSQSYNRYAYVMNNPMKFTDPSGYRYYFGHYWIDSHRELYFYGGSDGLWHRGSIEVVATRIFYQIWIDNDIEFSSRTGLFLSDNTGRSGGGGGSVGGGGGAFLSKSQKQNIDDLSLALTLETSMVEGAAKATISTLSKTTSGVKTVTAIGAVASKFGAFGGVITNSYDAYEAYKKGEYLDAAFQGSQAIVYAVSFFIPVGFGVSLGLSAIDIGEYFYKNW